MRTAARADRCRGPLLRVPGLGCALLLACGAGWAAPASEPLAWLDAGRPTRQAEVAIELLTQAPSHGLDAADYGVASLQRALQAARGDPDAARSAAPAFSAELTSHFVRYLDDLHHGRVEPDPPHRRREPAARPGFDAAAALRAALALQDLPQAVRAAAPRLAQYEQLRAALQRYRALGEHEAWRRPLPALPRGAGRRLPALEAGDEWPGVPALRSRLQALGDLEAQTPAPPAASSGGEPGSARADELLFDAALVAAVQGFQERHGLQADGIVGRATLAALQVSPATRARQLELALERLRWTPLRAGPRMIVVNVPEFRLRAYDVVGEAIAVRADMKVVVGAALDRRTPLLMAQLQHIEFNPHWNVPASIARKELVPLLRRQPVVWARDGYEFVGPGGADTELSEAKLQAVLDGRLRIRQRPGPRNALGAVKFVLPNRESIFLHDTPAAQLFEHSRRDFSHGCIRVEQPLALAAFALQGVPGWDEAQVRAATARNVPSVQALASPVPVLVAYGTALVKQGRVHFFDDIYGHDRALDHALARAGRRPQAAAGAAMARSAPTLPTPARP